MEILGIGWQELIFIVIIALIVLGPKDMQEAGRSLGRWLNRLVQENFVGNKIWRASARPEGEGQDGPSQNDPLYTHQNEGPDDMPGHIKSALTATQISIPVSEGRLALGTWQGVYLWEHRHRGGARRIVVHIGA